jgi:hypothetical protein
MDSKKMIPNDNNVLTRTSIRSQSIPCDSDVGEDSYLEMLRLQDKYTRKPTSFEIAKAFPECRDIARRVMDELIQDTEHWKDKIKQEPLSVYFMALDPSVKRINELQKFLNLTSPISNNRIDTTKAKAYPIQELYDFQKVRRSGRRIQCSCPFHTDQSPSFVIYLESNTCHCFSCQFNGDSIAFIQKLHNEKFINAVRRLSQ